MDDNLGKRRVNIGLKILGRIATIKGTVLGNKKMEIPQLNILTIFLLAFFIGVILKRLFPGRKKTFSNELWQCCQCDQKYVVSLKNGVDIAQALTDFVKIAGIKAGTISGLGAVNRLTLRFFDPAQKKYVDQTFDRQMEIANLTGNISTLEGKEYLHLHVTAGDASYQAIAGHMLSGVICGAGEFVVDAFQNAELKRSFSEEVGLNLYNFDK